MSPQEDEHFITPTKRTDDTIDFKAEGNTRRAGLLQPIAASILMGLLYAVRVARPEWQKAVLFLAKRINANRWCDRCDERLHRLICNVWGFKDDIMSGWIGDPPEDLTMHLFFDADFAGCPFTLRSTSGLHLDAQGPNSRFPLSSCCTSKLPSITFPAGTKRPVKDLVGPVNKETFQSPNASPDSEGSWWDGNLSAEVCQSLVEDEMLQEDPPEWLNSLTSKITTLRQETQIQQALYQKDVENKIIKLKRHVTPRR